MVDLLLGIPVAKILYSAILLLVLFVLGREIYTIWADRQLYVGKFEYFNEASSTQMPQKIFLLPFSLSTICFDPHLLRKIVDERNRAPKPEAQRFIGLCCRASPMLPSGNPPYPTLS